MPVDTSFDLLTTQLHLAPDGSATPLRPTARPPARHRDAAGAGVDRVAVTVRVDGPVSWTRCPSGDVVLCLLSGAVDVLFRSGSGTDGGTVGGSDGGTDGGGDSPTVTGLRTAGSALVVPTGQWYGLRGSPSGHLLTLTPFEPPRRPDRRAGDTAGRHATAVAATAAATGGAVGGGDGDPAGDVGTALFALSDGLWAHAVRAAATLRLADRLAAGPRLVDDLAEECGADADALRRLLAYLAGRGVFRRTAAGEFALDDAARLLCDDHPTGLRARLDADGAGGRIERAAADLLHTVRTGEPAYPRVFGRPLREDLAGEPGLVAELARFTSAGGAPRAADLLAGYDWSRARHVVDVGGGGALLTRILTAYPALVGTLVDLPGAAAVAGEALAAAGLAERCAVVTGSPLDALPATGDVYLLAGVLGGLADPAAAALLRTCGQAARSAGPAGRVVVAERNAPGAAEAAAADLRALVLHGGRVRDLDALAGLAAPAGLRVRSAVSTPGGVSLVEYVPPAT